MATSPMSESLQHLRRTMLVRAGTSLTDGQLLEDYLNRRDEAALAVLVGRHGPMVWGVCRRVLANYHDAEDAFQATFLVLVRKAASIASRELLANWLYGVAHQTALKARASAARRCARERQVTEMPQRAAAEQDLWQDLQPLLDEELSGLPDKYRAVLVLCDLEGKTRKEAARQLGVPEGTVASRMATARQMLARRLARRGLALSGGTLAMVLTQKAASAGMPAAVVSSTLKAAGLFAAGQAATGAISVHVASLTEGVLKTMMLTKLKTATVGLLLAAALGSGTGLLYPSRAAEPQKAATRSEQTENEKPATGKVEPDEAATPLGKIVRTTRQANQVYISLGKADNVRPKMALSVYANGSSPTSHLAKGTLEVQTVLEQHLSLARVTWVRDTEREPLVQGDLLYHAAAKRSEQRAEVHNGDKEVQELIHQYRGLSDKDKLSAAGDRIRERILRLSQSEQVALSPFTRDAAAATVAEHRLRGALQEAKNKQINDEVKRAVEEAYAKQIQKIAENARAERDQLQQKLREQEAVLHTLRIKLQLEEVVREQQDELRKRMQIAREYLIQQATKDVRAGIEKRLRQLQEQLEQEGIDRDNAETAFREALEQIEQTVSEMRKARQRKMQPKSGEEIHGRVQDVLKDKLLLLSVGSEEGVEKGQQFVIYRLEPKPLFLGTAEVVTVDAHSCVARLRETRGGQQPRKGDRASRELNGAASREGSRP